MRSWILPSLFFLSLQATAAEKSESSAKSTEILVVFDSREGGTLKLAREIAKVIESVPGAKAVLKRVPTLDAGSDAKLGGVPVASVNDLAAYDGVAFGSPVYFGNMSANMKHFLDQSLELWKQRALENLPGTVFMSAGSGVGKEPAIQAFWNTLASHGMLIVPTQTDLKKQGLALVQAARGLKSVRSKNASIETSAKETPRRKLNIPPLPEAPAPVGSYRPYSISGNLVFINQIALKNGKIEHPGLIGKTVTLEQAKEATRQTTLNVLAVLKTAVDGDLERVQKCVQLTGFFNTEAGFKDHAGIMNESSKMMQEVFGDSGIHARATLGSSSLPLDSPVEIQAIFEIRP